MKPTEVLKNEHRKIEQVLDCLEVMADRCESHQSFDADSARKAISFFRNYADSFHHMKEEDHLFPVLEKRGIPRENGPLEVMLFEHARGRDCLKAMDDSLDALSGGESGADSRFANAAREYLRLLRDHIEKEEHCLFTMADQVLTEADQGSLSEAFEALHTTCSESGEYRKYLETADSLGEEFGVD